MNLGVVHNPEASRFEVSLDTPTGRVLGWCSYRLAPGLMELHHTEVRACMGQNAACGLGGAESFDLNFPATMDQELIADMR